MSACASCKHAACRAARSERLRRAWQHPGMRSRRKPRHSRAWSATDDRLLRESAGELTPAELAVSLASTGMERTETAVLIRLKRLGLSQVVRHHSAGSLGALFGVDGQTVITWVRRGWLRGERLHDVPGGSWIFRDDRVEAFIRGHGHAFDWRAMRRGRWRSLAEMLDRSDPWLAVEQAALAVGACAETVRRHCRRGWLPSARRFAQGGARNGALVIRRSALALFRVRHPGAPGRRGGRAGIGGRRRDADGRAGHPPACRGPGRLSGSEPLADRHEPPGGRDALAVLEEVRRCVCRDRRGRAVAGRGGELKAQRAWPPDMPDDPEAQSADRRDRGGAGDGDRRVAGGRAGEGDLEEAEE